MKVDLDKACAGTYFLDHDSPEVREFVRRALPSDAVTPTDRSSRVSLPPFELKSLKKYFGAIG